MKQKSDALSGDQTRSLERSYLRRKTKISQILSRGKFSGHGCLEQSYEETQGVAMTKILWKDFCIPLHVQLKRHKLSVLIHQLEPDAAFIISRATCNQHLTQSCDDIDNDSNNDHHNDEYDIMSG